MVTAVGSDPASPRDSFVLEDLQFSARVETFGEPRLQEQSVLQGEETPQPDMGVALVPFLMIC